MDFSHCPYGNLRIDVHFGEWYNSNQIAIRQVKQQPVTVWSFPGVDPQV